MNKTTSKSLELMNDIRDRVLEDWKSGTLPFDNPALFNPIHNFATKRHYTGANNFILNWILPSVSNYGSVIGFHQAKDIGLKMRKGSKALTISIPIVLKPKKEDIEPSEDNPEPEEPKPRIMFKTGYVFPMECFKNFEFFKQELEIPPLPIREFIDCINPDILTTEALPPAVLGQYSPLKDFIEVLPRAKFKTEDGYFMTIFHELIHWTGHASRLDRLLKAPDKEDTIKEEMVAEFGSAMLCRHFNLEYQALHSNYLNKYFKKMNEDKKIFFKTLNQAGNAVDYLLGRWHDKQSPIKEVKI